MFQNWISNEDGDEQPHQTLNFMETFWECDAWKWWVNLSIEKRKELYFEEYGDLIEPIPEHRISSLFDKQKLAQSPENQ